MASRRFGDTGEAACASRGCMPRASPHLLPPKPGMSSSSWQGRSSGSSPALLGGSINAPLVRSGSDKRLLLFRGFAVAWLIAFFPAFWAYHGAIDGCHWSDVPIRARPTYPRSCISPHLRRKRTCCRLARSVGMGWGEGVGAGLMTA